MCFVQESLGATFTKMFQRLFGNASAGAAAMTIALVLRMGALAAIEHACVHLAGAASLADSADFESKGCVRSILDV